MPAEPIIHDVFEPKTSTWQYVVADPGSKDAVIIDPVLDFDPARNAISTGSADALLALVREKGYRVTRLMETHIHADHLTAAGYLQARLGEAQGGSPRPDVCIGKRVSQVQETFASRYGISKEEYEGVFNHTFEDDETFCIGQLEASVLHLPGHTPDHIGYVIGSNVFCGDSLFNVDIGSARCDFPGGSASTLYRSVRKLLGLPANYRIFTGHDYPPDGRDGPLPSHTVAEQRERNKHLRDGVVEDDFVRWRAERDTALAEPRLIHQSLQFNIRAGRLPALTGPAGDRLLHVPLKVEAEAW